MPLMITEDCINCGACEPVCPNYGISKGEMVYVIDQNACSECVGFFSTQQCATVCPMNCCVFNPDIVLSEEALFERAKAAHASSDTQPTLTDSTSHFRKVAAGKWWQQLFRSLGVNG
jgi:ferredoxin